MKVREIYNILTENPISLQIKENFTEFTVAFYAEQIKGATDEELGRIITFFNDKDTVSLFVSYSGVSEGVYNLSKNEEINELQEKLFELQENKEPDESVEFKLQVSKCNDNTYLTVYSLDALTQYLQNLSIQEFFDEFYKPDQNKNKFFYLKNDDEKIVTNSIVFSNDVNDFKRICEISREDIVEKSNEVVNRSGGDFYKFVPDDFYIIESSKDSILKNLLNRYCVLLCFAFFSNYVEMAGKTIEYKIIGHKSVMGIIGSETEIENEDSINTYYKIYKWIYNGGSVSDRCGIVRNVLSICINAEDYNLNSNVYSSIISCNEIYLKENVGRYIEVKNSVVSLLNDMNGKFIKMTDALTSKIKGSILTIVSFYFTTVLLNTISTGKINNIFTEEIAILSYSFIIGASIYFSLAIKDYNDDIEQYKKFYQRQKNFYADILTSQDIENIFLNDKPYKEDIDKMKGVRKRNIIFWCLMSLIFLITVSVLSNYTVLDFFNDMLNAIKKCFLS